MAQTQRDLTITVAGGNELELQLSDSTFIYLKDSGSKEVTVIIEGAPIKMAEGDLRKFPEGISKATIKNENATAVTATFVVGQGEFIRTRIFAGVSGAIGVRSTLISEDGSIVDNTIAENTLRIAIGNELGIEEQGSDLVSSAATWPQPNVVAGPSGFMWDIHTWDNYFRGDRKLNAIDSDNTTLPLKSGDASTGATFRGAFIHPYKGTVWVCTSTGSTGDLLFHEHNLSRNRVEFRFRLTAAAGETFSSTKAPSIDWFTGNLFLWYGSTDCREYKWTFGQSLGGPTYGIEAVRDFDFTQSGGGATSVHRTGDGLYIVGHGAAASEMYDTDANDNVSIGSYTSQDNVSGAQTGFGGIVEPQFYINERLNRTYTGAAGAGKVGVLFDLDADISLNIHDPLNNSRLFEGWKTPMPVTGCSVVRDGGYRFLNGTMIATCIKLLRGSNNIPADYMDYVYAIEFHNGTRTVKIDGGRSSFAALGKGDGFKINLDEPITLHTRAGLLDEQSSLYISDDEGL